jgi:protein involved in polysaccharide export with SLBB domain
VLRFKMILIIILLSFIYCISNAIHVQAQEPDYHLQPEDVLHITVYEQPDLDTRTRISSAGEISFPLLGKIKTSGITVSQLKDKIEKLLEKDYLVAPQVQVFIEQYHVKQVSVLGEVQKPGKYDMYKERETTVLEAIAMAGGFTSLANENGTKIIRKEDGQELTIPIKVSDITKKGLKEKDIPLKPGDIVFIPESFF